MNGLPYIKRYFDFSTYKDFLNNKFDLVPANNVYLEVGNATSTVGTDIVPHLMPELSGLLDVVFDLCKIIYNEHDRDTAMSYISRSWMNKHGRGGQTTEHKHEGVEFVMACYVSASRDSGAFECYYNGKWHSVFVESNDILVFPANLLHRTEVSNSDNPRIVITLNITKSLVDNKKKIQELFEKDPTNIDILNKHFINSMAKVSEESARIEMLLRGIE